MNPIYSSQWHFIHTHLPESSVEIRAGCPLTFRCSSRIFDQYCLTSVQDIFFPRTFSASRCQRPHRVQATILSADFSCVKLGHRFSRIFTDIWFFVAFIIPVIRVHPCPENVNSYTLNLIMNHSDNPVKKGN